METEKVKEKLREKDYGFLSENENLKENVCYLTLGGSIAYGTDLPGGQSDIDIRGITAETKEIKNRILLDLPHFEQFIDNKTDTVIYGLHKIIKLLLSCNPNVIEMLGTKSEHILYINDIGKRLRENSDLFLSKLAIGSFGGYAGQQLNRLANALARDRLSEEEKEEHILRSLNGAMMSFNKRYSDFENGKIALKISNSKKSDIEKEICADIVLHNYPLRDFNGIINELSSIARNYSKLNNRNTKKDDAHLNKHAMHLIRLYLMAIDILEKKEIVTYRIKEKDFLLDIRNGKFMNSDGTYNSAFFDLQKELETKFKYAAKHTELPDKPDYAKVIELVNSLNDFGY